MSQGHKLALTIAGWLATVITLVATRLALVTPLPGLAEALGWFFIAMAPVGVVLALHRGSGSSTIAGVLYDAEQHQEPVPHKASK